MADCGFLGLSAGMVDMSAGSVLGEDVRLRTRQHYPVWTVRSAPVSRFAAKEDWRLRGYGGYQGHLCSGRGVLIVDRCRTVVRTCCVIIDLEVEEGENKVGKHPDSWATKAKAVSSAAMDAA